MGHLETTHGDLPMTTHPYHIYRRESHTFTHHVGSFPSLAILQSRMIREAKNDLAMLEDTYIIVHTEDQPKCLLGKREMEEFDINDKHYVSKVGFVSTLERFLEYDFTEEQT